MTMKLAQIEQTDEAIGFVEKHLPSAQVHASSIPSTNYCLQLEAVHCSTLFFRLRSSFSTVAEAFQVISEVAYPGDRTDLPHFQLQRSIPIDDYSLSQTTLDEVFVSFAMKGEALTRSSSAYPLLDSSVNSGR